MSVEQIETEIRRLSANDLGRLTAWLSGYLASRTSNPVGAAEADWPETADQVAELERRLAEFRADPGVATPFEPDYFENLKRQLADERAMKASPR